VLQQHVDHKITNALLKKGTRNAYKTWNQQESAWVDMSLHESHDEGRFGVTNNTIFQLSGPAAHSSAQPHSVATPPHAAAHQALAPIQGLASALRQHEF
jgi:hypothetical protein